MSAGRWDLASAYLYQFQGVWTVYGEMAKAYALDHGATVASVNAIPSDLSGDGALGVQTAKVIHAVLLLMYGAAAIDAGNSTPTAAGGVSLWFRTKVAPLAPPSDGHWAIWNATQSASASDLANDLVGQVSATYMTGGATALAHFEATPRVTPPSPDTNPGSGSAPVPTPTQLPTTPRGGTTISITGSSAKVPTWIWVAAGGVALGAAVGVGYYVVKNRPDLFRSRRKKRRR